jgi:hypothetical protein
MRPSMADRLDETESSVRDVSQCALGMAGCSPNPNAASRSSLDAWATSALGRPSGPPTLFDACQRTNPSPAGHEEDSFAFLNRVEQPYWDRVRCELERWFADFPAQHAVGLRARFRDRDPAQHYAAWWELYLHRFFCCLGFDVEVNPRLSGVIGEPDFLISGGEQPFLIEAATTFSGIAERGRHGGREAWIKAAVDQAKNPDFFVSLTIERGGMERPAVRQIVAPLEKWLGGSAAWMPMLSPGAACGMPRCFVCAFAIGSSVFGPFPLSVRLGVIQSIVCWAWTRISRRGQRRRDAGRTLERKRRQHGRPDQPLLVAVLLLSPLMENEDIEQALLGGEAYQFPVDSPGQGRLVRQRDGFWLKGERPRGTRVSAVMTATNLMPWTAGQIWPRLWPNPWAKRALETQLPLPRGLADTCGRVAYEEVDSAPYALLDLPKDWPGPEAPFSKRA